MSKTAKLLKRPAKNLPCITLIGMAGCGKTTVGLALAKALGWAFMDTDQLIESAYGTRLQDIADRLTKDEFLDMEAEMICSLRASRTVVATGGSVVYRETGMRHLQSLGPVVRLDCPLAVVLERISHNPERGLAIAEGQTIEDLYLERQQLYIRYADIACNATRSPSQCAEWILARLPRGIADPADA